MQKVNVTFKRTCVGLKDSLLCVGWKVNITFLKERVR